MRNPLEVIADLYDYQYDYYRWYIARRVMFNDVGLKALNGFRFDIFSNNDSENTGKLIAHTTMGGFFAGLGFGGSKIMILNSHYKQTFRKALPAGAALLAVSSKVFNYLFWLNK
jgi:hypothetical protein